MIKELIKWLDFSILNQEEIKKEWGIEPLPQWNVGYLEALLDTKKQIGQIDAELFENRIKKASSSVGNFDFTDAHYKGD